MSRNCMHMDPVTNANSSLTLAAMSVWKFDRGNVE